MSNDTLMGLTHIASGGLPDPTMITPQRSCQDSRPRLVEHGSSRAQSLDSENDVLGWKAQQDRPPLGPRGNAAGAPSFDSRSTVPMENTVHLRAPCLSSAGEAQLAANTNVFFPMETAATEVNTRPGAMPLEETLPPLVFFVGHAQPLATDVTSG
jgi:hypothetical protein